MPGQKIWVQDDWNLYLIGKKMCNMLDWVQLETPTPLSSGDLIDSIPDIKCLCNGKNETAEREMILHNTGCINNGKNTIKATQCPRDILEKVKNPCKTRCIFTN